MGRYLIGQHPGGFTRPGSILIAVHRLEAPIPLNIGRRPAKAVPIELDAALARIAEWMRQMPERG